MKPIAIGLIVVLVIGGGIYGYFQMKRSWNYSWGYESRVQDTVCEMVKPESLINPSKCD